MALYSSRESDRQRISSRSIAWSLVSVAIAVVAMSFASGCTPQQSSAPLLHFDVTYEPAPPRVGPVQVQLAVTDAAGQPVSGASIRIEGNMNHAGMKPSFAELNEVRAGIYTGTLDFTMGGDWFLLISTTTQDGTRSEHQVDVPGVQTR